MKTYRGAHGGFSGVTVDGRPLPPRLDLRNHSPTGYGWSYGGSGPAQLALAILCDHLGDDAEAEDLYQAFKWRVIANLAGEWTLTTDDIDRHLAWLRVQRSVAADLSPDGALAEDLGDAGRVGQVGA